MYIVPEGVLHKKVPLLMATTNWILYLCHSPCLGFFS